MTERHMTLRLGRISDVVKTEFKTGLRWSGFPRKASDVLPPPEDVKIALGYDISRDSSDGRPAHIWAHLLRNENAALMSMAGIVTRGCIANIDMHEKRIPDYRRFLRTVTIGNRVSPGFAGTRPMRWATVLISEHARDAYWPEEEPMWKKVLYPQIGAYWALLRDRLPVALVTDSHLEQGLLEGVRILFVADPEHLTGRMRASLESFEKAGGLVVRNRPEWQWHAPDGGQEAALRAFRAAIADEAARAPVQVRGGPELMQAGMYATPDGRRVTVAICNDYSWVTIEPLKGEALAAEVRRPLPPTCEDVSVTLRLPGKPRVVRELVSGGALSVEPVEGGVRVAVPDFDIMRVLVAEY